MITVTKVLSEEHQHILRVVELLEKECSAVERGKELRADFFKKVIQFICEYADKFHHKKEEDILFVELCKESTNMHCNPTQQMRYEHELGRGFVKEMEEGLKGGDIQKVISGANSYIQLIREHIHKEDNILYPMAEEALGDKEKKELELKFKETDEKNKRLNEDGLKIMRGLS
jgi:hemerythrin-like domain-containing protein